MDTPTLLQILTHTPLWVWALFAALLALGATQLRQRSAQNAAA